MKRADRSVPRECGIAPADRPRERRDLDERRRAERAVRESERRYRMLWDTAPDAVLLLDQHGTVLYANPAVEALFGHAAKDVVGRDITLLQPPRLHEAHKRGFARYLASGMRRIDWRASESTGLNRDGHEFPLEVSFSHNEVDGEHLFAGFLRDITDRKRADAARSQLLEQLRESQKLEALGTLAGGIAHDFNNLLAAILGNVALAQGELGLQHPAASSVDQIRKAGERARDLVRQILAFSRRQPVTLRNQPLQPLVEETVDLLRATLPAGVRLQTALPATSVHVMADATQIEQVVMNLCMNAWHALQGRNGTIGLTLTEAVLDEDAARRPDGLAPGRYARLTVSDDGHGMDAATRGRIFEPFFTTKAPNRGTGLGLSVAHGIVAEHGGGFEVESEPGRGSTFHLYLPQRDPPATGEAEALAHGESAVRPLASAPTRACGTAIAADCGVAAVHAAANAGGHVLLVDDDELIVVMAERLLSGAGYRVTCCTDGEEALEALRHDPQGFDAVVTDYNMPGLSGLDVAAAVPRLRADLPVLISSGFISEELRASAAAVGASALLNKQDMLEEVLPAVMRVLALKAAVPLRPSNLIGEKRQTVDELASVPVQRMTNICRQDESDPRSIRK